MRIKNANKRKQRNKSLLVMLFIAIIIPLMASTCGKPPPASPSFEITASPATITMTKNAASLVGIDSLVILQPTATTEIKITKKSGFDEAVNLSLDTDGTSIIGLEKVFTPSSVSGDSSILKLTIGSSTLAGTYNFTVRGKSASAIEASTPLKLIVKEASVEPDFRLTINNPNLVIKRENSNANSIGIERLNGLSGAVNLFVSGLPFGVSIEDIDPNPAGGNSSTLKLLAGADAELGTKLITITGKIGDKERTVRFNLTITDADPVPDFNIEVESMTVKQTETNTAQITINRENGFSEMVDLSFTILPPKMTVDISPTSANASSVITVTPDEDTTAGEYTLELVGTAAGKTRKVNFKLTVVAVPKAAVIAYLWADNIVSSNYTPDSGYSYNSSGGTMKILRSETGKYKVSFAGLNVTSANIQLTAYDTSNYCNVDAWSEENIEIRCYNSDGNFANTRFSLVVVKKDASSDAKPIAYVFANKFQTVVNMPYTPKIRDSYNSADGAITATRLAVGKYSVVFSGLNLNGAVVQVTGQSMAHHCNTISWNGNKVLIDCYDNNGNMANNRFHLSVYKKTVASTAKVTALAFAYSGSLASYEPADIFHSKGDSVTVEREGEGSYKVLFSSLQTLGGNFQVATYKSVNSCRIYNWGNNMVRVRCYDSSNTLTDNRFFVTYIKK